MQIHAALITIVFVLMNSAARGQDDKNREPGSPHYEALPAEAVGVLAWDIEAALKAESRVGPPNALGFAAGESSYRWIYVPCPDSSKSKESLVVLIAEGKKRKRFDNVCLLDADTAQHFDLEGTLHLVLVEVNSGLGSPATDTFVATAIRKIDNSAEYPLDPQECVRAANQCMEVDLAEHQADIQRQMEKLAAEVLKEKEPTGPREHVQELLPTWLARKDRLRIVIRYELSDGHYQYAKGTEPSPPPEGEKGEGNHQQDGIRFGTTFGVVVEGTFEFSKRGELVRQHIEQPQAFQRELPPPE